MTRIKNLILDGSISLSNGAKKELIRILYPLILKEKTSDSGQLRESLAHLRENFAKLTSELKEISDSMKAEMDSMRAEMDSMRTEIDPVLSEGKSAGLDGRFGRMGVVFNAMQLRIVELEAQLKNE